ncbi:hypothetical protein ACXYMU_09740 [Pontibacter sp. CAU 1760]
MGKSTRNHSSLQKSFAVLLATGFLLLSGLQANAQEALTVIANQKGAPATLSSAELHTVFFGEKQRWNNGIKVTIALLKTNNDLGEAICRQVYNMKPDELNKYWLALVFQGKVSAPNFFNTVSELQTFVGQNPGSIGIVNEIVPTSAIRTVLVDGKKTL